MRTTPKRPGRTLTRTLTTLLLAAAMLLGMIGGGLPTAHAGACLATPASAAADPYTYADYLAGPGGQGRRYALQWADSCFDGLPADLAAELAALDAAAAREAAARAAALAALPRLTVTGGTKAERAKVRRLLAAVRLPRGTLIAIVREVPSPAGTIRFGDHRGNHGRIAVARDGYRFEFVRPSSIRVRRSVLHSSRASWTLVHEAAHAAQAASGAAPAGQSAREIQADCMTQARLGAAAAKRHSFYLKPARHACSKAELATGREIWAAVP